MARKAKKLTDEEMFNNLKDIVVKCITKIKYPISKEFAFSEEDRIFEILNCEAIDDTLQIYVNSFELNDKDVNITIKTINHNFSGNAIITINSMDKSLEALKECFKELVNAAKVPPSKRKEKEHVDLKPKK